MYKLAWCGALAALGFAPAVPANTTTERVRAGKYLYQAAGCGNCHTDKKQQGAPAAGGRKLETPFGIFYTPNITPHPQHGIGRWNDADVLRALRQGIAPGGTHYYPAFPYTSYTGLVDEDIAALKAYLFTLKPVAQANKPHQLIWYVRLRPALRIWKAWFFTPGPWRPAPDRPGPWNRGAYLANAVLHCGECHTPRNFLGGFKRDLAFAGTRDGPEGGVIPNITPDPDTGIGHWSRGDLIDYLKTGARPDGDFAGGAMAEVIDDSLRVLTKPDLNALVDYLQSLPPVAHRVRKAKDPGKTGGEFD